MPYIEEEKDENTSAQKSALATVKGGARYREKYCRVVWLVTIMKLSI